MNSPVKAFYALLGFVGVAIIGGVGVFYFFDSQLGELNDEVGKLLAEQEAIGEQIKIYEATEEKVSELAFVPDLANDVLPSDKEQANVVAEIRKFIVDAGLSFSSVTFSGSEVTNGSLAVSQTETPIGLPGVRVLPVTAVIDAGARYEDIITLLQTIENNQRKMQVTDISLTPEADSDRFSSITMQIQVYVRVGGSPAPATQEAPAEEGTQS